VTTQIGLPYTIRRRPSLLVVRERDFALSLSRWCFALQMILDLEALCCSAQAFPRACSLPGFVMYEDPAPCRRAVITSI
jgi:hypothetical protein